MIKFWPNKKKHGVDVEVNVEGVIVNFFLDMEQTYESLDDLTNAAHILETDWVEGL